MITKEQYFDVLKEALYCLDARFKMGPIKKLNNKKYLNFEKITQFDIFHLGLYLVCSEGINVYRNNRHVTLGILNNIIDKETDPDKKIIKLMKKEAVLNMETNSVIEFIVKINSVTPFSLKETLEDPEIKKYFIEDRFNTIQKEGEYDN
jgi:hypothetical protein